MCRKEAQPTIPASSPDRAYNPGPRIRAFIASAKEPRQTKSNGTFTIRDAEWNIEAALNMGRVDPNARFGDTRSVKYIYRMDVSEGLVTEDDVLSGYLALEADLDATELDFYEQATVVDVSNEVDGIEVLFTAEMFIGKNPDVPVSYGPPYTNNLTPHKSRIAAPTYWWCDYPLSADLVVKDRVNYGLGIYPCCLTDVETWYVRAYHAPIIWPFEVTDVDLANRLIPTVNYPNPWEDPQNPNDDYLIYRTQIYNGSDMDCEPCVNVQAMQVLVLGSYNVMLDIHSNYVTNPNVVPISMQCAGTMITWPNGTPYFDHVYYHSVSFTYGRWYDGTLEGE
jgi:hypothetical protein